MMNLKGQTEVYSGVMSPFVQYWTVFYFCGSAVCLASCAMLMYSGC